MNFKPALIVFFLALGSAVLVHYVNHVQLLNEAPTALRKGISVATQDDSSYLAPFENFLIGNDWRSNAVGDAAYLTRTPGYSFIYAVFRFWIPQKSALIGLLCLQFLLFALSAIVVFEIMRDWINDSQWALWIAVGYAILPMFSGFLSYTLTEGVTPMMVLLFMYLILKGTQGNQRYYLGSAAVLAMLIIIRPPMVVFVFVYPIQLLVSRKKSNAKQVVLALVIALCPLAIWQIYGYAKTDKLPGLHAIYHDDANDLYRPVHKELWDFHKSWGQAGNAFHSDVNGIWQAALNDEPPEDAIDRLMGHLPSGVAESVGLKELHWTYKCYYNILKGQRPYFESGQAMYGQTPRELALIDSIQTYKYVYRSSYPLQTWVVVPAKVYWKLAAHSNMSLFVFQKTWRGKWWMEALRILSFAVHLITFLLFPLLLFKPFRNARNLVFSIPIYMYLAYLCFVQRGVEERYTLPFLVPMILLIIEGFRNIPIQYLNKFKPKT